MDRLLSTLLAALPPLPLVGGGRGGNDNIAAALLSAGPTTVFCIAFTTLWFSSYMVRGAFYGYDALVATAQWIGSFFFSSLHKIVVSRSADLARNEIATMPTLPDPEGNNEEDETKRSANPFGGQKVDAVSGGKSTTAGVPPRQERLTLEVTSRTPGKGATTLSETDVWRRNRDFYKANGQAAWDSGTVPLLFTSNSATAHAYATTILGFVADRRDIDAPDARYTIVEVGAGHGRFSFLCAFWLERLAPELLEGSRATFTYVVTDVSEENVVEFQRRPALTELPRRRVELDYAIFDADTQEGKGDEGQGKVLYLVNRQEWLLTSEPIIVVGNYVFGSLSHDLFRCSLFRSKATEETVVFEEGLVQLESESRLGKIAYREVQGMSENRIAELDYYQRKADRDGKGLEVAIAMDFALQVAFQEAARVLREKSSTMTAAAAASTKGRRQCLSFSFPIGGMRAVERLRRCCATEELLVLVADNGHERLLQADSPSSIPRSYALASEGMFFGSGSMACATHPMFTNHRICAAYLPGNGNGYTSGQMLSFYRSTAFAFSTTVQNCPPHAFFDLLEGLSDEELSPGAALRVLQLSKFDPVVFVRVANALLDQSSSEYDERKLRATLGGEEPVHENEEVQAVYKSNIDFPDPYAARFALAASTSLSLLFDVNVLKASGLNGCGTTWQDTQSAYAHLVGRVLHLLRHEQLDAVRLSSSDSALSMDALRWFKLARTLRTTPLPFAWLFNEALSLCRSGKYKLAGEFVRRCAAVSKGIADEQTERLGVLERARNAIARAHKAKG